MGKLRFCVFERDFSRARVPVNPSEHVCTFALFSSSGRRTVPVRTMSGRSRMSMSGHRPDNDALRRTISGQTLTVVRISSARRRSPSGHCLDDAKSEKCICAGRHGPVYPSRACWGTTRKGTPKGLAPKIDCVIWKISAFWARSRLQVNARGSIETNQCVVVGAAPQ